MNNFFLHGHSKDMLITWYTNWDDDRQLNNYNISSTISYITKGSKLRRFVFDVITINNSIFLTTSFIILIASSIISDFSQEFYRTKKILYGTRFRTFHSLNILRQDIHLIYILRSNFWHIRNILNRSSKIVLKVKMW